MNENNLSQETLDYDQQSNIFLEEDNLSNIRYDIDSYLELNSSEHFKRMGFLCAIEDSDNPKNRFAQLKHDQKNILLKKITQVEEVYNLTNERFLYKLEETEKRLEKENINLEEYQSRIKEIHTEKAVLEEKKEKLQEKIYGIYDQIGQKRDEILDIRIKEVKEKLEEFSQTNKDAYGQRFSINQQSFNDNQASLQVKVKRFEDLKNQYEQQQENIRTKVENLQRFGVTPQLTKTLLAIGFTASLISSYFFSIFALEKGLNDENIPFFFFSGVYNFINGMFGATTNLLSKFLVLFFGFSSFLVFFTLIFWVCNYIVYKIEASQNKVKRSSAEIKKKISFEINQKDGINFEAYSQSNNFYHFWLQLLPMLSILSFFTIILFLGITAEQIPRLDISLSGSIIGAMITFLVSCLVFIYITKIVEPRVEKNLANNTSNVFRDNAEFVVIMALVIISLVTLTFIDQDDSIVIITYIGIMLAISFLIAYSFRFRSLFTTYYFLERRINLLYDAIKNNSRPIPPSLTGSADSKFKKEYFKLQDQLFKLLEIKNERAIDLYSGKDRSRFYKRKKIKGRRRSFWRNPFRATPKPKEQELSESEQLLFNKEYMKLNELRVEQQDLQTNLNKLIEEKQIIQERTSPIFNILIDQLNKLRSRRDNQEIHRIRRIAEKNNLINKLSTSWEHNILDMKEGFDLGIWYRENGIGPNETFYTKLTGINTVNNPFPEDMTIVETNDQTDTKDAATQSIPLDPDTHTHSKEMLDRLADLEADEIISEINDSEINDSEINDSDETNPNDSDTDRLDSDDEDDQSPDNNLNSNDDESDK